MVDQAIPKSHHLDDLAHHPTPLGLFFSILTQFTKTAHFQNSDGTFLDIAVEDGLLIGTTLTSKLFCGCVNWFYHLVSDMSGSNKTAGVGMGIPGPIVSMLKEISCIPGINKTALPQKLKEMFVKEHFDLRSELAALHELGRQAVPVILNEVLVRSYYLFSRLSRELKEKQSLAAVEWRKVLPWKNRTIIRMLTVATGTFMLGDFADAAIRSGGVPAALVLRVNFVGVGRFVIAVAWDIGMGIKRNSLRDERIYAMNGQLELLNAKTFYMQAKVWRRAESAAIAIEKMEASARDAVRVLKRSVAYQVKFIETVASMRSDIEKNNPGLLEDLSRKL